MHFEGAHTHTIGGPLKGDSGFWGSLLISVPISASLQVESVTSLGELEIPVDDHLTNLW